MRGLIPGTTFKDLLDYALGLGTTYIITDNYIIDKYGLNSQILRDSVEYTYMRVNNVKNKYKLLLDVLKCSDKFP